MNMSNGDPAFFVQGYVWITLGWYHEGWWTENISGDDIPGCNDSMIEVLLYQTLAIRQANSAPDGTAPTDVNLVSLFRPILSTSV